MANPQQALSNHPADAQAYPQPTTQSNRQPYFSPKLKTEA
jgi:hypothetical protein